MTSLQGKSSWCSTAGKGSWLEEQCRAMSRHKAGWEEKGKGKSDICGQSLLPYSIPPMRARAAGSALQVSYSVFILFSFSPSFERVTGKDLGIMIWQHSALHIELRNLQDVLLTMGYLGLPGLALGSQPFTCLALICLQHLLCEHDQSWPLVMLLAAQAMENLAKHRWWSCVAECKQKKKKKKKEKQKKSSWDCRWLCTSCLASSSLGKKSLSSLRALLCLCNPKELKFIPPESCKSSSPWNELKLDSVCKTQCQTWILLKFGVFNAGNFLPPMPEVTGLALKPWSHSLTFPEPRAAWAPGLSFRPLQLKVFK